MFWMVMVILSIFVIEETTYYFWNRYVYGPNVQRIEIWKNRFPILVMLIRRKHKNTETTEPNNHEKSSL
ncbi:MULTISPECIES: hypothetical protein [Neobacillus]|uniref:Uncharacterized protein n=1 Tax=Neobacillus citreus TaxID=2833578 RepID=A0A9J6MLB7_9BACI|nr:hypothetical protein [Neobacillus citreus]MCH6264013.1 hypothetical protein [Neobacillus citreus]